MQLRQRKLLSKPGTEAETETQEQTPSLLPFASAQESLNNLVSLLVQSATGNSAVQANLTKQLAAYNEVPDYCNYLAFIFALTNESVSVRAVAGLTLKNDVLAKRGRLHPAALPFLKAAIMQALGDPEPIIRSTAGTIITTLNNPNPTDSSSALWPDVVPTLLQMTDSQNPGLVEGAFGALSKICEDSCNELDNGDQQILAFLTAKLLAHMRHDNPKVRVSAIESLNQFIFMHSGPLFQNMDFFVSNIYQLTGDSNKSVRKAICQSLVLLFEVAPETIVSELENIVNFMLFCTQDDDESVSLQASEFWLAFAEQEILRDHLEPYLPKIVPVLARGMVYTEDEIAMLGGDKEDAHVPDSLQDIKPRHLKSRNHTNTHEGGQQKPPAAGADTDDVDGDEDDYDDDGDEDADIEWNVRKCSAAAIDVMATVFKDEFLRILLPHLQVQLTSSEWTHREAGILCLGAIAEGCMGGMIQHLPQLVPMLAQTLKDKMPLVRSITCWTLGRYSSWIVHGDPMLQSSMTPEQRRHHTTTYFEPVLHGILVMSLDNNKRVQETGCSALAVIEDVAGNMLVPYLVPILQTLANAFPKYQYKNLLILYDALGTLADTVGNALNNPQLVEIIVPRLMEKWDSLDDNNPDIFPLFECFSSLAVSFGTGFMPLAPTIWSRCLRIIHGSLIQYEQFTSSGGNGLEPDKDFLIVSLDLLSGVVHGLGAASEQLVVSGQPNAIDLLIACMNHPYSEVRQSACALVGDFATHVFPSIKPRIPEFLNLVIPLIQPPSVEESGTGACNNAAWACGEIALKMSATEMQPWVPTLLQHLVPVLLSHGKPALKENAAITIGRLSISNAALIAPVLQQFAREWCQALGRIRDNLEKESAFMGFCQLIVTNPNALVNDLVYFCDAVVQWNRISPELNEKFRQILTMYASGMGPQWKQTTATWPALIQARLNERYSL
eukprot:jgi/Hompol1/5464/HPOL_004458-RA